MAGIGYVTNVSPAIFSPPLQIGFLWYVLFVIRGRQWQEVIVGIVIPRAPLPVSFVTLGRLRYLSEQVPSGEEDTATGTCMAATGLCCEALWAETV